MKEFTKKMFEGNVRFPGTHTRIEGRDCSRKKLTV